MMRRRLARAFGQLTWQRVLVACVVALVAWFLGRHGPYWLAREFAPHWSAAPKHWIAANPESKFSGIEERIAAACAVLAGVAALFRPRSNRAATGMARWLYDRMAGGIVRFLLVALPTAIVWFLAQAAIHALFYPAMHHPPTAADRGTELAFTALVTYLTGSIVMVWQAVWNAEWRWSEGVAQRENVSPTFLRLASGITSGPFDIPTRPGCGPTLLLGVLGSRSFYRGCAGGYSWPPASCSAVDGSSDAFSPHDRRRSTILRPVLDCGPSTRDVDGVPAPPRRGPRARGRSEIAAPPR